MIQKQDLINRGLRLEARSLPKVMVWLDISDSHNRIKPRRRLVICWWENCHVYKVASVLDFLLLHLI